MCGNFGERHCGQATVATGVAFHCDRRERVLLRDILRLGTATVASSYRVRSPAMSLDAALWFMGR